MEQKAILQNSSESLATTSQDCVESEPIKICIDDAGEQTFERKLDSKHMEEENMGVTVCEQVTKQEAAAEQLTGVQLLPVPEIAQQCEHVATANEPMVTNPDFNNPTSESVSNSRESGLEVRTASESVSLSASPNHEVSVERAKSPKETMLLSPNHSEYASESSPLPRLSPEAYSNEWAEEEEEEDADAASTTSHMECIALQEQLCSDYEQQLEQLRAALAQKESMILLFQRENDILEKEKQAFRKEMETATKEKESTVIKFAMKEKLLIDAKKEKEAVEKQLADARKEIKNVSTRFQAINEEKSRITYIMDEKCNEVRKYQRECEKWKTDYSHLESKLKYHVNKLNMEIEARTVLERKLEEERNAPNKLEEKANEKLKMQYEANTILLKHDLERKTELIENLTKEHNKCNELVKQLQEQLSIEIIEKTKLWDELKLLQEEHNTVQNSYSEEMLNSAKLRGQLEELQILKTQNTLNEEKLCYLNATVKELDEKQQESEQELQILHAREEELLSIHKEISESIVGLQTEICMLKAKSQALETENEILVKQNTELDARYSTLAAQLKDEERHKSEERQLLTKHLSEKTKLYEITKVKLENALGELEATKNKHATVLRELQREIQKYKKTMEQMTSSTAPHVSGPQYCSNCSTAISGGSFNSVERSEGNTHKRTDSFSQSQSSRSHSRNSSNHSDQSSRRPSESSESETVVSSNATAVQGDIKGPSKKHLVERILRLQQASARQTEKIDFLENHTLSLVAELQKKSKVVQYYMLRDQAGALTSTKSDQHKSELAKYGNGVMSAIYNGVKGVDNNSMTLELSLEINKKLQAVLEDTLLKNITLKENLDVLGLEVDNLTRKLRQLETKE